MVWGLTLNPKPQTLLGIRTRRVEGLRFGASGFAAYSGLGKHQPREPKTPLIVRVYGLGFRV